MIRHWALALLAVQAGAALALAWGLLCWWRPSCGIALHPASGAADVMNVANVADVAAMMAALALGCAAVLLVRLLISANNFRMSRRAGSVTPPEHAARPARAARLFWQEFATSMLTSSYYMLRPLGMRLQPGAQGMPVLLIHGYACNSGYWHAMSAQLAASRISHYGIDLEPLGAAIDDFVPQVAAAIEKLCAATGSKQVVIVAHSMGGLVARAYLRGHGAARVARVITLGTPHHGTALAHFGPGANAAQMRVDSAWLRALSAAETAVEANLQRDLFTSIYSVHDNIVAPQNSSILPGARNLTFGAVGHVALGHDQKIMCCVLDEIAAANRR